MQRRLALALIVSTAACVESAEVPATEPALALPGREHQGRRLLGKGVDGLAGADASAHWSLATAGVTAPGYRVATVTAEAGALTVIDTLGGIHDQADPSLIGVTFAASDGSTVRIDSVALTAEAALYQLSRHVGATRTPLCDAGAAAVVVPGSFARDGEWLGGDRLTVACADGVAHKCVAWGQGPDTGDLEPCTRMARADYCNNGNSHTLDGTEILFYDFNAATPRPAPPYLDLAPPPPPPVAPNSMWFEAAWKVETGQVICLSKLRWQALPLGGHCPAALPDPRVVDGAKFCEDLRGPQVTTLIAAGAVLLNESTYNDLGLYQWQSGDRYFTTTGGQYGGLTGPTTPPALGYATPVWQGTVWTTPGVGRVELRAYLAPATGKLITTTLIPPAGYSTQLGPIGYLSATAIGGLTEPLKLYYHPARGQYLTTAGAAPAGYGAPPNAAAPVRLGYVLRP